MTEIKSETFDILEELSKKFPDLKGYYARGTGGADLEHVFKVLYEDWKRLSFHKDTIDQRITRIID